MVWVVGAPPQNLNNIVWHGAVQTPPCQVFRNTFAGLWSKIVGVFGAPPQNPNKFFGVVQFRQLHPRYPEAPLLAYEVQWYGWLGRHPRTQTIFFGMVQFKHPHPRYLKTFVLAYGVQGYWHLGRQPKNIFWHCAVQKPSS